MIICADANERVEKAGMCVRTLLERLHTSGNFDGAVLVENLPLE